MERRDNYETQRDYSRKYFLEFDQQELLSLWNLEHDDEYIYITFVGKEYRLHRASGVIESQSDQKEAGFNETLAIFDFLCYGKERPVISNVWAPINSVKYTPKTIGVATDFSSSQADYFDQYPEAFSKACECLGGTAIPIGDIGYEIPVFEEVKIRIKFYRADDEFSAQMVMLWDEEILRTIRYETSYYVMGHIYHRLREEMEGK